MTPVRQSTRHATYASVFLYRTLGTVVLALALKQVPKMQTLSKGSCLLTHLERLREDRGCRYAQGSIV